ncbi:hypothetical protein [Nonomuraea insulae]|uniref:TetR family transcriptional regulator n=1 Tax=Nonomuraea insulae TaxID=1616787 RepID=A0ABW1CSR1_9ACTN
MRSRDLLAGDRKTGAFAVDDITDAANTVLGGFLLAVLGRSMAGADATFRHQLTEQTIRGILTR